MQRSTIDFVGISLGIVMSLRQAATELTFQRPPQVLCTTRNFTMLLISVFIPSMTYLGLEKYLQAQPFWQDTPPNTSVSSLPVHSQFLLGHWPDCLQDQVLDHLLSHLRCQGQSVAV